MINTAFWKGKRILLTGHTGFKGSWLSLWLQSLGSEVVGYALAPPTSPSLFTVAAVEEGMTSLEGDIRDLAELEHCIREHQPKIVFHLAAQSLVRQSYVDPVSTYATNIMGTVNLLEAIRHSDSIRAVIVVTSDKCYENREWYWGYRESDSLGGYDPYSSSKGCAELVISAYRQSFFSTCGTGAAIASVRAGNVIGGGDWARDRLIPDMVSGIMNGMPIYIRSPDAVRPWQFVLEPLHGYLSLAERLYSHGMPYAEAWNFGPNPGDSKKAEWIATKLATLWGEHAAWQLDIAHEHPHEAGYLNLDSAKACARLDWKPLLELPETLGLIVDWYKNYRDGKDMRQESLNQIARFTALM